ncbi:hypothetical protein ASJ36_10005 [Aeromonas sp. ARM81]|nr:hypothetical protein ASJ36_10005 [Aeromonas sp. ARM81]
MVMAHPLGSDTSSQVQGYAAVKKVGVPDFRPLGCDTSSQVQDYAAVKKVGVPDFTPRLHNLLIKFKKRCDSDGYIILRLAWVVSFVLQWLSGTC